MPSDISGMGSIEVIDASLRVRRVVDRVSRLKDSNSGVLGMGSGRALHLTRRLIRLSLNQITVFLVSHLLLLQNIVVCLCFSRRAAWH